MAEAGVTVRACEIQGRSTCHGSHWELPVQVSRRAMQREQAGWRSSHLTLRRLHCSHPLRLLTAARLRGGWWMGSGGELG